MFSRINVDVTEAGVDVVKFAEPMGTQMLMVQLWLSLTARTIPGIWFRPDLLG